MLVGFISRLQPHHMRFSISNSGTETSSVTAHALAEPLCHSGVSAVTHHRNARGTRKSSSQESESMKLQLELQIAIRAKLGVKIHVPPAASISDVFANDPQSQFPSIDLP